MLQCRRYRSNNSRNYISTYVDDFLITAKVWKHYKNIHNQNPTILDYYLVANYLLSVDTNWYIAAKQYILESIKQIENRFHIQWREERTSIKTQDHIEDHTTPFLDIHLHWEYQALMGCYNGL